MAKKKILIVAPYGFNERMANFAEFIVARLLAKNNWQVICLTRQENKRKKIDFIRGIKIYRYRNLAQGIFFLLKILIISRPTIVHIFGQRNNRLGILTAVLAKLSFKPLLFTEYGLLHDHYLVADRDDPLDKPLKPNGLITSLKQIFTKFLSKKTANLIANIKNYFFHWALTHADQIIFVSRHNLPLAKELGLKNYSYLPYILDNARWDTKEINKEPSQDNLETQEKIKRLQSSRFCLFVGQLKLRKGWDTYLEAIPCIDKATMPLFVVVTSSTKEPSEDFCLKLQNLGIEDRVVFFGQASGQTLKTIYDLSSIVVVPSRYEGFGLIAAEAFAANKPLIASAVPALTEFVIDGYNGLMVRPKNPKTLARAINRLASNKELGEKLVSGGRITLAGLKSDELKNQWLNFYEELISK